MRKLSVLLLAALALPALSQTPVPAKGIAPAVASGAKLPSQIVVEPSAVKAILVAPPPTAADEAEAALAKVKTLAESLKVARQRSEEAEKRCATRSYSSKDMQNAGCADSDTVAVCSTKLYKWCTHPTVFEYKRQTYFFQKAIQDLDQKARALAFPPETP